MDDVNEWMARVATTKALQEPKVASKMAKTVKKTLTLIKQFVTNFAVKLISRKENFLPFVLC